MWTGRRAKPLHDWSVTPQQAIEIQRGLAGRIVVAPPPHPIRTVAGLDVAVGRFEKQCRAGAVLLDVASLTVLAQARVTVPVPFPYVPGLLSFREVPGLLEALARLPCLPDALILDGHGFAHPRRFGIACHLGLWCDIPAFGVAKSILVGEHPPLGARRGSTAPLLHHGEQIGAALRTRHGVKPVYVSVGHRFDLPSALELALQLAPKYRLVEPIRRAHALVSRL